MGLRYRKSINLGGGFRVNFSKSGVGYSWGTKGYRVTKKAGGGTRTTYSIPGTGLSWSEESGSGRKRNGSTRTNVNQYLNQVSPESDYEQQNVVYQASDADVKGFVTDNTQAFLAAIKKYSKIRTLLIWSSIITCLLMVATPPIAILFVASVSGWIYLSATQKICLEYDCDEYGNRRIQMMNKAMTYLCNNKMVWQVDTITANSSTKTHAGAAHSVQRKQISFQKKKPFFLKTDAVCYYVKLRNDDIFILPDRLIVKGKKGWGTIEYSELHIGVSNQVFVESLATPKDALIVGRTWQYVNKNGGPDKRYKDNRQLPECNYGKISFQSDTGLDVLIYISNINNAKDFGDIVSLMIEEAKTARIEAEKDMQKINSSFDDGNVVAPLHVGNPDVPLTNSKEEIADASASEQIVLNAFEKALEEHNLSKQYKSRRQADGSLDIIYSSKKVGSFFLNNENGWLSYQMGVKGKWNSVEGTTEEVLQHISKWIRYIINYME